MPDGGCEWVFPVAEVSFSLFIFGFYKAPLGRTVALSASSRIPVRPQPLRACAEPQAGVSPPCTYVAYTDTGIDEDSTLYVTLRTIRNNASPSQLAGNTYTSTTDTSVDRLLFTSIPWETVIFESS